MGIFIAVTILVSLLSLVIFQSVKSFRLGNHHQERVKHSSYLLLISIVMFSMSIVMGGNVSLRMASDLSIAIIPMMLLTTILWKSSVALKLIKIVVAVQSIIIVIRILCLIGLLNALSDHIIFLSVPASSVLLSLLYICAFWMRVREIRMLMKSGTVWNFLCLGVEMIYILSSLMLNVILLAVYFMTSSLSGPHVDIVASLLGLELIALGLRVSFDSAFIICHKLERIIVESMKLSQVEMASSDSKTNDIYKDIYERILLYFEMQKPFLENDLTINDLVRVVYSNKVYISKAISSYTGRNFCQFVNYYRVMYAMDQFRNQPNLKVAELAAVSGFNTVVSFSSAFRLFMNETPSEWCRKEKSKLLKMKK